MLAVFPDHSLAVVNALAVGRRPKWEAALKGFNMIESELVREWKAEARSEGVLKGEVKAKVEWLIRVVKRHCPGVTEDVLGSIPLCTNVQQLDRWLDIALTVD